VCGFVYQCQTEMVSACEDNLNSVSFEFSFQYQSTFLFVWFHYHKYIFVIPHLLPVCYLRVI